MRYLKWFGVVAAVVVVAVVYQMKVNCPDGESLGIDRC